MVDKPDWNYWGNLSRVELMDAILLSLDADPRREIESSDPHYENLMEQMKLRARIAQSHAASRNLVVQRIEAEIDFGLYQSEGAKSLVQLTEFRRWGESLPTPIVFPELFPRAPASPESILKKPEKPLSTREKNSLLLIIKALASMAKLPPKGYAEAVVKEMGGETPRLSSQTIRKVINDAREMDY